MIRDETWANVDGAYVLASWSTHNYDRQAPGALAALERYGDERELGLLRP